MKDMELELFKEDYIKKLKELKKRKGKKWTYTEAKVQTNYTMSKDPFMSLINELENGIAKKKKEKIE